MKNTSWKTTGSGIAAIIAAVASAAQLLLDGNTMTNPDWAGTIAAVTAGFGLIFARDNDKPSEGVNSK